MRRIAAVANTACRNRDSQIIFAHQVCAAPAGEDISGLCRLVQRDCRGFYGIGIRIPERCAAVQIVGDGVGIERPVCRVAAVAGAALRDGDGQVILARQAGAAPAGEGVAGACGVLEGKGVRLDGVGVGVALCRAAVQIVSNGVLIDRPLRRDRHIMRRHGRGNCRVPTGEGIAFSCRVGRRGDGYAVVLRDGRDGTAAGGVEGDGILIDLPLRPIFLVAHFCTADCRHRIAGQTLVIIPALERVAGIGHIVGCRECCAHTVDVFGDIAVVDRAAVGVQCDGIGRVCPLHCQCCHISRNTVTGNVEFTVASAPHKEIACISVRAVQTIGRRRGKLAAGFHDDLNILGAIPACRRQGQG